MATRRGPNATPERLPELLLKREDAHQKVSDQIRKGQEIAAFKIDDQDDLDKKKADYTRWDKYNSELLTRAFTNAKIEAEYSFWTPGILGRGYPNLNGLASGINSDVATKIERLESILERLPLVPEAAILFETPAIEHSRVNHSDNNKVFIVHGHEHTAKSELEILLRSWGLDPVVLHRQADEGGTIIEKFERHSDVGYAFVILTPDEISYLRADESKPDADRAKEFRARPNVIFEFGYFVGRLGRPRVCCLHTGNVSLPSDVSGMIYKSYAASIEDAGLGIMRELKAAGYTLTH